MKWHAFREPCARLALLLIPLSIPAGPAAAQAQEDPVRWSSGAAQAAESRGAPGAEPVRLQVHRVPLAAAIERLVEAGAPLAYTTQLVEAVGPVSCDCDGLPLRVALERLLRGTGIEFHTLASGEIVLVPARPAAPAVGSIRGRVVDAGSGEGIHGATVTVVGAELATTTDARGAYVLNGVPAGRRRVRAQRIGYQAAEMDVDVAQGATAVVDFRLTIAPVGLQALDVRVSTGTLIETAKRSLGTSIAVIGEEEIRRSGAKNLREVLHAAAPGVASFTTDGANGSGGHIRVRGSSSFMYSQAPLIYIDGAPVDGGGSAINSLIRVDGLDSDRDINQGAHIRLDELSLDQIERIEIVKGPAATTLYGTEAINGVIQIFTKRGVPGQTRVTASADYGFGEANIDQSFVQSSPWADELRRTLFRTAVAQRYSATVSGGQGNLTYRIGGSHHRDGGTVVGNGEQQTSLHGSFGGVFGDDLSFRVSGSLVRREFDQMNYRNLFSWSESDRVPATTLQAIGLLDVGTATTLDEALKLVTRTGTRVSRVYGSANLTWRPFRWLQNDVTIGLDRSLEESDAIGRTPHFYVFLGTYPDGFQRNFTTRDFNRISARYVGTVSTAHADGRITSTLSVGMEGYRDEVHLISLEAHGLPSRNVTGFIHSPQRGIGDEEYYAVAAVGGFIQEQVGFGDRLFLTAGLRADGNSTFGDDFGLQLYPKLGRPS